MPDRKNEKKKQARLEAQILMLADRLAIAMSNIEDDELEAFFEGLSHDDSKIESGWLLSNDEVCEAIRERWRKTRQYVIAKHRIKKALQTMIRGNNAPQG